MAALLCTVGMCITMEMLPPVVAVLKLRAGCAGQLVFPAPCSSVAICHWGSHGSTGPSSHERRERKCFFQSCCGVLEGLSYDPASHPHCGVAEEPSPVPVPRTRRRCGGNTRPFLHPSPSLLVRTSAVPRLINPTVLLPPALSGSVRFVPAAFTQSLSLHPRRGSPEALPMLIWVCF